MILASYLGSDRRERTIDQIAGHIHWNIVELYNQILSALALVHKQGIELDSIGIDTWGCDVAYFGAKGNLISLPYCYRGSHTEGAMEAYFERMPAAELYNRSGIQFMPFNTIFQLDAINRLGLVKVADVDKILFIPDALNYMLTGVAATEYSVATTGQIVDAQSKQLDEKVLSVAGIRKEQFGQFITPGTVLGELTEQNKQHTGITKAKVIAVAGHDTASAVAAVPAENERFAYLSSGTWSLMGIETKQPIITEESFRHNFTNEGGVDGTTRFLKNICGMWILEQCRKEWSRQGKEYSYPEIVAMAQSAEPFQCFINPDDATFANPESMLGAIESFCSRTCQQAPQSDSQIVRTIFESLALRYRQVLEILESMAPFAIDTLHIIGGGAKNALLNQYTANATGKRVVAGPSEATAIGNIMMQAVGAGVVGSVAEARKIIRNSIATEEFIPQSSEAWNEAYSKFVTLK